LDEVGSCYTWCLTGVSATIGAALQTSSAVVVSWTQFNAYASSARDWTLTKFTYRKQYNQATLKPQRYITQMHQIAYYYDSVTISLRGRHRNAHGRPFSLLKCRPSHSTTTGGRIATQIVALTPSMKKSLQPNIRWTSVKGRCLGNQFCGARQRQAGIPSLHYLCWHLQRLGRSQNLYPC